MALPVLNRAEPWAPHPQAAPRTAQDGEAVVLRANGTRTLAGGWQYVFGQVQPGARYRLTVELTHEGLDTPRDQLRCLAFWADVPADIPRFRMEPWDHLVPTPTGPGRLTFSRDVVVPEGASHLTLRYALRWTASGSTTWQPPRLEELPAAPPARPVRVAVVTGQMRHRQGIKTIADNVEFYAAQCEAACRAGADLALLPEVCLQWGVDGTALDRAVAAPGPETDVFAALARQYGTRLGVGLHERDGDAVYNALVLIAPDGRIDGKYHKVHLAEGGEDLSGVLPGDDFPVIATELGRLGGNICMDSSAAESSRMVGLNGADFLLLPIMGDHRADRWTPGPPIFCEHRWLAIQRTHAMDNQLCLVIARNTTHASCIIDRKGDVLAWNDGDRDFVSATVNLDDGYRGWSGGCNRDVNWMQRRPGVYGPFVDPWNVGSLRARSDS